MKLLFHPTTRLSIDNYQANPSGSVLLCAPAGSGKGSVAIQLAASLLDIDQDKITDNPNVMLIAKGEESISIEDVRGIASFLKLKTTGDKTYRRAVVIEYVENMGIEAQNAFLKGLEEPPKDTLIILTTNNAELLLPTITSRVQTINILPSSKSDIMTHFFNLKHTEEQVNKAYLLSEGAIGLMTALLTDDKDHTLIEQIELAKDIYRKTVFERLNLIDNIAKNVDINNFLVALERVSHAALQNSVNKADRSVEAWNNRIRLILESQKYLRNNPNAKLLLSNLFINL